MDAPRRTRPCPRLQTECVVCQCVAAELLVATVEQCKDVDCANGCLVAAHVPDVYQRGKARSSAMEGKCTIWPQPTDQATHPRQKIAPQM